MLKSRRSSTRWAAAIWVAFLGLGFAPAQSLDSPPLDRIQLPEGFSISIYARAQGARSMARGSKGTLFVGTRSQGNLYAIPPDGLRGGGALTLATGLILPNGVAFKDGSLYLAENHRILRFDNIEDRLNDPPEPVVVLDNLPSDRRHGWRFIRFGPDGRLYVPVGAPCNVCEQEDERYAALHRMSADMTELEVFARGIRNTVGFDWHPETGDLWFTENGRDWLGDEVPPDELNRATEAGLHFGFPYCHGEGISDPHFGKDKDCSSYVSPAVPLGAHVAPLGVRFYTGEMFPQEYRNRIFVAEHGSWNRTNPLGYRISVVRPELKAPDRYQVFAEGWLDSEVWGRPVDLLVMPDGALLVSDDTAGAIYRISYSK